MSNASVLRFAGEKIDPVTGTYALGNGYRVYSPALMRFIAPDSWSPFGAGGRNPYVYCGSDPINGRDPNGHFDLKSFLINTGGDLVGAGIMAAMGDYEGAAISLTLGTAANAASAAGDNHLAMGIDAAGVLLGGAELAWKGYGAAKTAKLAFNEASTELEARSVTEAGDAEIAKEEQATSQTKRVTSLNKQAAEAGKKWASSGVRGDEVPRKAAVFAVKKTLPALAVHGIFGGVGVVMRTLNSPAPASRAPMIAGQILAREVEMQRLRYWREHHLASEGRTVDGVKGPPRDGSRLATQFIPSMTGRDQAGYMGSSEFGLSLHDRLDEVGP
jgi:RHS repeat-associated protein